MQEDWNLREVWNKRTPRAVCVGEFRAALVPQINTVPGLGKSCVKPRAAFLALCPGRERSRWLCVLCPGGESEMCSKHISCLFCCLARTVSTLRYSSDPSARFFFQSIPMVHRNDHIRSFYCFCLFDCFDKYFFCRKVWWWLLDRWHWMAFLQTYLQPCIVQSSAQS